MLNRLLRLRSCRLLALLATLLLASALPHGHVDASEIPLSVTMATVANAGDAPDQGPSGQAHCGTCHAARAVVPHPAGTAEASELSGAMLVLAVTAAPKGQHSQVPARPPRAGTLV